MKKSKPSGRSWPSWINGKRLKTDTAYQEAVVAAMRELVANYDADQQVIANLSLAAFVKFAWPIVEPDTPLVWGWALDLMCENLEAVSDGRIKRLLITVPPGMMKSLLTSVFWPAWEWAALGRPGLKYLCASYKEDHATRDSRRMRKLITDPKFTALYGDKVKLKRGGDSDFEVSRGGWRKARSVSSLTGDRGDRVILDDPQNVGQGDSQADRERVVRLVRETAFSRVNDPKSTAIVVIQQRIHSDDLAGVIISERLGFQHLNLAMMFDPDRAVPPPVGVDPRTRKDELLFPERFPLDWLQATLSEMGSYAFEAQYQQNPAPRGGYLLKRDHFCIMAPPVGVRADKRARAWDYASTDESQGGDPDYTVGIRGFKDYDGVFWIEEVVRFRKSVGPRDVLVERVANSDGWDCYQRFAQDPGQAGVSQVAHLERTIGRNSRVQVVRASQSKIERALPLRREAELGRVRLIPSPWNEMLLDELASFPVGRHDDMVDALSDLIDELSTGSGYDLSNLG